MIKLNDYIKINRQLNISPNISYKWYGELYSNTKALFYDVPTISGIKKVFAFISYPKTEMPQNGYPALLLIHGGNGSAFYEMSKLWSDRGYLVIAPDFNGKYAKNLYERNLVNENANILGYGSFQDMESNNPWAYFSVLSCMSAVDVLINDGIVDKNNICSCGLSWGGFINLLFLSQEERVKAGSVIYSSAYISDSNWAHQERVCGEMDDKKWAMYNKYIDPKNYISSISCPVFFTAGADDVAFTMENRRKTAELIKSKKYFGYRYSFPHGNFYGFEQKETDLFFKSVIKNQAFTEIDYCINNGEIIINQTDSDSEYYLVETKQDYTESDKLEWSKTKIENKVKIKNETKAYFIEQQKIDCIFSTNVINV